MNLNSLTSARKSLLEIAKKNVYTYSEIPFKLASGGISHHYFNCKTLTLVPDRLRMVANIIRDELMPQILKEPPLAVGGLTLGADPIAIAISLAYLEKNLTVYPIIVRKESKSHGTKKLIECQVTPNQDKEVIVLDDTITTGNSTLKAVKAMREFGFIVNNCIALIDRNEGGKENLEKENIKLYSLFNAKDFY